MRALSWKQQQHTLPQHRTCRREGAYAVCAADVSSKRKRGATSSSSSIRMDPCCRLDHDPPRPPAPETGGRHALFQAWCDRGRGDGEEQGGRREGEEEKE
eukprot:3932415-Rhodomonas_salina.1